MAARANRRAHARGVADSALGPRPCRRGIPRPCDTWNDSNPRRRFVVPVTSARLAIRRHDHCNGVADAFSGGVSGERVDGIDHPSWHIHIYMDIAPGDLASPTFLHWASFGPLRDRRRVGGGGSVADLRPHGIPKSPYSALFVHSPRCHRANHRAIYDS
ncbi:MAG: hypothetical protein JWN24_2083 [Phycisphaerales bacterium]|nr:hypothetical protein [Phycisphaerales bacterium]